ncbi:MAG: hypothetical protein WEK74_07270 [Hydrogenophaga sp.]
MADLAHPSSARSFPSVELNRTPWAQSRPLLPWPDDLLTLFGLRMSSHGMSISRIDMRSDARYALRQLSDAREMGDATLAHMADELFRFFEAHQSGLLRQTQ